MDEDTINKQTKDNSEETTERERRPSEEQGSGESSRTNLGSTEANRPNVEEEYLNNWKRERADFLNYKKDESRRMEEFVRYANEDLVLEMMELVDDLEIVVKEVPGVGLEHVVKKFSELFRKYGVERISVEGQFNPALHEAVLGEGSTGRPEPVADNGISVEADKEDTKMVEVRSGYTLHGKVIRPARVKLTK